MSNDAYYARARVMSPEEYDRQFGERDGRLRHRKIGEKSGIAGPFKDRRLWEPVACWNCGKPGGYVTVGTPIFYVCRLCVEKHGEVPAPVVPGTEDL